MFSPPFPTCFKPSIPCHTRKTSPTRHRHTRTRRRHCQLSLWCVSVSAWAASFSSTFLFFLHSLHRFSRIAISSPFLITFRKKGENQREYVVVVVVRDRKSEMQVSIGGCVTFPNGMSPLFFLEGGKKKRIVKGKLTWCDGFFHAYHVRFNGNERFSLSEKSDYCTNLILKRGLKNIWSSFQFQIW